MARGRYQMNNVVRTPSVGLHGWRTVYTFYPTLEEANAAMDAPWAPTDIRIRRLWDTTAPPPSKPIRVRNERKKGGR